MYIRRAADDQPLILVCATSLFLWVTCKIPSVSIQMYKLLPKATPQVSYFPGTQATSRSATPAEFQRQAVFAGGLSLQSLLARVFFPSFYICITTTVVSMICELLLLQIASGFWNLHLGE